MSNKLVDMSDNMIVEKEDEVSEKSTEEIPRHKMTNPYNYTDLEKSKRSLVIDVMISKYPHTPVAWITWLYDILEHKTPEEIKDIIETKAWEGKPKVRDVPGTIPNALTILEPGEDPHKSMVLETDGWRCATV